MTYPTDRPATWFVTGTSRGLGLEVVTQLLERGDNVAATTRSRERLLAALGDDVDTSRLLPLVLDLRDETAVNAAARRTLDHFGSIDVVVNNAGYGFLAAVEETSAQDVRDMLDVLAVLEAFAARLACRVAPDADIAEVRRLHDRMVERYAVRDRLEYFKLNQAIHSAFLRLAGNATLEEAHASIQSRMKRIRYVGNEEPPKWAAARAEHEDMIRALEARDGEALAAAVTRHLENTWARVLPTLA